MNKDIPETMRQVTEYTCGWRGIAEKDMAPVQVDEPLLSLDNGIKNYSSLFPWDTAHKVHVIGKESYSKNFYNYAL